MSAKRILIAVLIIVVIAGGYSLLTKKMEKLNFPNSTPAPQVSKNESNQISPTGISIVVNEQNGSGESGIAIIREVNGKVNINIKLIGGSVSSQPAHFHLGVCEKPGKVVYPLTNVVNGESETVLGVDMVTFNQNLPLILNVHKSEQEFDVYTACGPVTSQ